MNDLPTLKTIPLKHVQGEGYLWDVEDCDHFNCPAVVEYEKLRDVAILHAKKLPIWCSCGALCEEEYEAIECPIHADGVQDPKYPKDPNAVCFPEWFSKKHKIPKGEIKDLGAYEWIKKFFNLTDEDIKEAKS